MKIPISTLSMRNDLRILHADDDQDDCLFFKEVLEELEIQTQLTTVYNGEQLMQLLTNKSTGKYDVLFLDLNMPRKNGFTCLEEIKLNEKIKDLPVIIFSTSYDKSMAEKLFKKGAMHYISKPAKFSELKSIIQEALLHVCEINSHYGIDKSPSLES